MNFAQVYQTDLYDLCPCKQLGLLFVYCDLRLPPSVLDLSYTDWTVVSFSLNYNYHLFQFFLIKRLEKNQICGQ